MAESPKTKSNHETKLTLPQANAIYDIRTHLNFFQVLRPELDNLVELNDVSGIRKLFENKKITSKRALKIVNQFADAFNFTISTVSTKKKKVAGKKHAEPVKQKKNQQAIIIQRLIEAEKNQKLSKP